LDVPLTVLKEPLTVTAEDATRAYGEANPTFTETITGAVNGDTFAVSGTTTATVTSSAGKYPIAPAVTGINLANYTVTYSNGTLTVTAGTAAVVTVTSSPTNPVYGDAVTISSTVMSGSQPVSGSLMTVTVVGLSYTCTTNAGGRCSIVAPGLPAGNDAVQAVSSSTSNAPAGKGSTTVMVAKQATRVQLTPSAASVQSGSPITLAIKVTSAMNGIPTGDVTLFNEKEVLGVVTLSNGEGSLAIPALTATTSSLSAVYNGDTNYLSSTTANTAGVEVIPGVADFTIGSTTATTSTSIGAAAVFTITIGAAPGLPFNNPVVLTVTGLPAGMSSTFNPQMVTPADGTVTSAMSVIPYLDLRSRNERQLPYGAIATCLLLPLLLVYGVYEGLFPRDCCMCCC